MILLPVNSWKIRDTKKKGKGVYTLKSIPKHTLVAQYTGRIVPYTEIDLATFGEYLMDFDESQAIVPDLSKHGAHLINHSCDPNCWLLPHEKGLFFASIRDIEPNEELTIHYLYHPLSEGCEDCWHQCSCESDLCMGTMHSDEALHKWWHKFKTS